MGKLVKTAREVGEALGVSEGRIRQLKNNSTLALCMRTDGQWDLEKCLQWNALRKDLKRPPTVEEMSAENLDAKAMTVANTNAVAEKYRENRLDILDSIQAKSAAVVFKALERAWELLPDMKPHEVINLLGRAGMGMGIMYDKSRLEAGESTENIAMQVSFIKELKKEMHDGGV
jgi:hypothetical protein